MSPDRAFYEQGLEIIPPEDVKDWKNSRYVGDSYEFAVNVDTPCGRLKGVLKVRWGVYGEARLEIPVKGNAMADKNQLCLPYVDDIASMFEQIGLEFGGSYEGGFTTSSSSHASSLGSPLIELTLSRTFLNRDGSQDWRRVYSGANSVVNAVGFSRVFNQTFKGELSISPNPRQAA
jgi:hypothetical protein